MRGEDGARRLARLRGGVRDTGCPLSACCKRCCSKERWGCCLRKKSPRRVWHKRPHAGHHQPSQAAAPAGRQQHQALDGGAPRTTAENPALGQKAAAQLDVSMPSRFAQPPARCHSQPTGTRVVPFGRSPCQAMEPIPPFAHGPRTCVRLHRPSEGRPPVQTRSGPRLKIAGGTSSAAWASLTGLSWDMEPRSAQAPSSSRTSLVLYVHPLHPTPNTLPGPWRAPACCTRRPPCCAVGPACSSDHAPRLLGSSAKYRLHSTWLRGGWVRVYRPYLSLSFLLSLAGLAYPSLAMATRRAGARRMQRLAFCSAASYVRSGARRGGHK